MTAANGGNANTNIHFKAHHTLLILVDEHSTVADYSFVGGNSVVTSNKAQSRIENFCQEIVVPVVKEQQRRAVLREPNCNCDTGTDQS